MVPVVDWLDAADRHALKHMAVIALILVLAELGTGLVLGLSVRLFILASGLGG